MEHRICPGQPPVRRVMAGLVLLAFIGACRPSNVAMHADSSAGAAGAARAAATSTSPGRVALASSGAAATARASEETATDTTKMCATTPLTAAVAQAASIAQQAKSDHLLVTDAEYGGWKMFHVYCYRCHGVDAMGGAFAPNLRESVSKRGTVTPAVFVSTVLYGRLDKGMPAWRVLLDCDNVTNLWAYLQARSSGRLAPGRPHTAAQKG